MNVENYNEPHFKNSEFINHTEAVLDAIIRHDWEGTPVAGIRGMITEKLQTLKFQVNKESTSVLTGKIEDNDTLFDKSHKAIKAQIRVFELSPIEEEVRAALVFKNLVKAHGWNLHKESYSVELANGAMLFSDMESIPEVKDAIVTLTGMDVLIQRSKLALQALKESIELRRQKEVSLENTVETKELRKEINDLLNAIYKYLEVMSEFMRGATTYQTMIANINNSISKIETAIKLRGKRSEEEVEEIQEN